MTGIVEIDGKFFLPALQRFVVRRCNGRMGCEIRVEGGEGSSWRKIVQEMGSRIMAALVVLTATGLCEIQPSKTSAHRRVTLGVARLVAPWDQVNCLGVPVIPKDGRSDRVVDEIQDCLAVETGMIRLGCKWWPAEFAHAREEVLDQNANLAAAIRGAEKMALSPALAESIALLAAEERKGMADVRKLLTLPFPRFILEFQGVDCGVEGERFALLFQADGGADRPDAEGILFALSSDHYNLIGHDPAFELPAANFILRIEDETKPLVEIGTATSRFHVRDAALLERFVTAALAFLSQPKLVTVDRRSNATRAQPVQAADRVRAKCGLAPLASVSDIHLNLDAPAVRNPDGGSGGNSGGGRHGTALHQVRSFWRYRRGRLEVVRSHWRGDAAYGTSRRRYTFDITDPGTAPSILGQARQASRDASSHGQGGRRR